MKTNTLICLLAIMFLLFSMMLSCNKSQTEKGTSTQEDDTVKTEKLGVAIYVPVSHTEYSMMKGLREFVYSINTNMPNNPSFTPIFIDPYISVSALKDYLEAQNSSQDFDGIRFYPVMNENKMMLAMCLGKTEENNIEERAYLILEKTFYLNSGSLPPVNDNTNGPLVNSYHNINYLGNVKIFGNDQTFNSNPSGDTLRKSRTYPIGQIMQLIDTNCKVLNLVSDSLFLKFETGYVDSRKSQEFADRLNGSGNGYQFTPFQVRGFTVLISLIDKWGNSIADPSSVPSGRADYTRHYLEVGLPCPPRCGNLSQ